MFRARMKAIVHRHPEFRSGSTNGNAWSFYSAVVLDEDVNKVEVTLADGMDPNLFGVGQHLDLVVDVSVRGARLRVSVVEARPIEQRKAA